jgi:hypothetical protein
MLVVDHRTVFSLIDELAGLFSVAILIILDAINIEPTGGTGHPVDPRSAPLGRLAQRRVERHRHAALDPLINQETKLVD